jgi:16S rRNA (guanine527-N7)-methyltransferase
MVTRHILDSLSVLPWLNGRCVLDVGSGAGLPGIPLAIVRPGLQFYLLDSNAKRTRFMLQVVTELGLENVGVVRSRTEDYRPEKPFDCIVARAFSSIAELLLQAGRFCAPAGRILAMKGQYPAQELNAISAGWRVIAVHMVQVPGLDAVRHVVHLTPLSEPHSAES